MTSNDKYGIDESRWFTTMLRNSGELTSMTSHKPGGEAELVARLKVAGRALFRERVTYWEDLETLSDVIAHLENAAAHRAGEEAALRGILAEMRSLARANDMSPAVTKCQVTAWVERIERVTGGGVSMASEAVSETEPGRVEMEAEREALERQARGANDGR